MCIEPTGDLIVVVPLFRQQIDPLHCRMAINETRNAHAIVEMMPFAPNQMDLTVRMPAAHMISGCGTRNPIANDKHFVDDLSYLKLSMIAVW